MGEEVEQSGDGEKREKTSLINCFMQVIMIIISASAMKRIVCAHLHLPRELNQIPGRVRLTGEFLLQRERRE